MYDFGQQYKAEMTNQEIKSNKRTILGFYWFFGVAFGAGKDIENLLKSADEKMYNDKIRMKGSAR